MSAHQAAHQIQLMRMPQLIEAKDIEDDWTGLTDAASRRKKQNRLNVRAYRRRKALALKTNPVSTSASDIDSAKNQSVVPCWIEDQQAVSILPASVIEAFDTRAPLIPSIPSAQDLVTPQAPARKVIFPLSSDHLLTLLQYNVLRACLTNRQLLSLLKPIPMNECSSAALHVLPDPSSPSIVPPSLYPTALQLTVPHEEWIDMIPHPTWRDNLILAIGTFDEDELWSDTIGGLFEGFPHSEVQRRGVIAWWPPWDVSGWEVSEGFWRKWVRSFGGCEGILEATNRWRRKRGEEPLV